VRRAFFFSEPISGEVPALKGRVFSDVSAKKAGRAMGFSTPMSLIVWIIYKWKRFEVEIISSRPRGLGPVVMRRS